MSPYLIPFSDNNQSYKFSQCPPKYPLQPLHPLPEYRD